MSDVSRRVRTGLAGALSALLGLGLMTTVNVEASAAPTDPPAVTAAASDWQIADAQRRLRLTVRAAGLTGDVTNFPVKVTLTADKFDYAAADQDALFFRHAGGSEDLPYEVETWDATGTSTVWVKVPVVGPTARTLDLYYDGTAISAVDGTGVWDDDFLAVHHFEETDGDVTDSTANGTDGTVAGGPTRGETGRSGTAIGLDGVDDHINLGKTVGATATKLTASASVLIDQSALDKAYSMIAARDSHGGTHPGEQFALLLNEGKFAAGFKLNGTHRRPALVPVTAGWHDVVTTYDGATVTNYLDGELVGTASFTGTMDADLVDLVIGSYSNLQASGFAKLTVDEFRLSGTARSADWLKAETLATTGALITSAVAEGKDDEPADPTGWVVDAAAQRVRVFLEAPGLGADVTNFPVKVRLTSDIFDPAAANPAALAFRIDGGSIDLPYEVESWNHNGESLVWVQVPAIGASSRTLDLYYDGTPASTVVSTDVWDEDFKAVHHFEEADGDVTDSTRSAAGGTVAGGPVRSVPGHNGGLAFDLDGTDDHINLGKTVGSGVTAMTASASIKISDLALGKQYAMVAGRDDFGGTHPGEQFTLLLNNGALAGGFKLDGDHRRPGAVKLTAGWHDLVTTYDGSRITNFIDGEPVGSIAYSGAMDATLLDLVLGNYSNLPSAAFAKMRFDEFRVSDVARSADWVKAEHLSWTGGIVTHAYPESKDGESIFLAITGPADGQTYGGGLVPLTGSVSRAASISYTVDEGTPVNLGEFTGEFAAAIEDLATGEHTIVVTADAGAGLITSRTATITINTEGPTITFESPEDGANYDEPITVKVSVEDSDGVEELKLSLDGNPIANGASVDPAQLTGDEHELVATATDKLGNNTAQAVQFTTWGEAPGLPSGPQPEDGAADVDPKDVTLSVAATDPLGDPLEVNFHWSYSGGVDNVMEGTTKTAVPSRTAGTAVDNKPSALTADDESLTTEAEGAYPFQRFEVAVPRSLGAAYFNVDWSGTVPQAHRAAVSIWNYGTKQWEEIAEGVSTGDPLELTGTASVSDAVRNGTAQVLVQDVPKAVIDEDDVATFAWITDTQHYTNPSYGTHATYQALVDWTLANREAKDISYGIHTGDIVDGPTDARQWQHAARFMRKWDDADFPYGIVAGNHDKGSNGDYWEYRSHFGSWRYEGRDWYGGTKQDNVNHYDLLSTPGAEYLVLYLDWELTQDEIDWANEIIQGHPNHNVILATHMYLHVGGRIGADASYGSPSQKILNQIVLPNPNVDLVVSGHWHGVALNIKRPTPDRTIVEVLFDPQEAPGGGGGWMRTIDLDSTSKTMTQETFSVIQDGNNFAGNGETVVIDESDGEIANLTAENFTVPLAIDTAQRSVATDALSVSATSADVLGGSAVPVVDGRASLDVGELEPGTTYEWAAEATDDKGNSTLSPVFSFTTADADEPVLAESTVSVATLAPVKTGAKVTVPVAVVSAGEVVPTGSVSVTVDGVTVEADLDTTGKASVEVGPFTTAGTKSLTVSYAGDAATKPSSATASVVVTEPGEPEPDVVEPGTPTVSGKATVGSRLTVAPGTWAPADADLAYQWLRDGEAIVGATGTSYELVAADVAAEVSVRVTGSKSGFGSASAATPAVAVEPGLIGSSQPAFSGAVRVGKTVTARVGGWGAGVTQDLQWLRDGTPIAGATSPTYTLTALDAKKRISLQVTGVKPGFVTVSRISDASRVAKGALSSTKPRVKGKAVVGKRVKLVRGAWRPSGVSYSVQWYVNGRAVTGATGKKYKVRAADAGKSIMVKVTGRLAGYQAKSVTSKVRKVRVR